MNNLNDTLPGLMHRATENLEPVSTDLLERTVQQGLRKRRRRTTLLTATGAGAVLATAGLVVGTTQLLGEPSEAAVAGTTTKPSPTPTASVKPPTSKDALATLKALIRGPGITLSKPETWGDEGVFGAAYVVDDGQGAARVDVLLTGGGEDDRCAVPTANCTTLPDGSTLYSSAEQPEYPGDRNTHGVLSNYVLRRLPDGRIISLTSYNAPSEKGSPHTRAKPILTVAELSTLAQSKSWKLPPKGSAIKPAKGSTDSLTTGKTR